MSNKVLVSAGVVAALVAVLTLRRFGIGWELPAYAYMSAMAVALGFIDLKNKLLPNRFVLPSLAVAIGLLTFAAAGTDAWGALLRAILGGAAMFILYLIMALISPAGLGMGDVKLAAVLGVFLGFLGWNAWVVGLFSAFLIGGVAGLILILVRMATRSSTIPFGPPMLLGALIATYWTGPLVNAVFP
ncbi:prepilin peptidase [Arthrobacter monumenti]